MENGDWRHSTTNAPPVIEAGKRKKETGEKERKKKRN